MNIRYYKRVQKIKSPIQDSCWEGWAMEVRKRWRRYEFEHTYKVLMNYIILY